MFGTNGGVRVQRTLSGLIQTSEMGIVHGTVIPRLTSDTANEFFG